LECDSHPFVINDLVFDEPSTWPLERYRIVDVRELSLNKFANKLLKQRVHVKNERKSVNLINAQLNRTLADKKLA
jgi:hypothetical protein